MGAIDKAQDNWRRAAADSERPIQRPPMKLVPVGPEHPRILYVTYDGLRCVLRPLKRWPEGVVDLEVRRRDSMDHEIWVPSDAGCITLNPSSDRRKENDHVQVLACFLRTLVPELQRAD